MVLNVEIHVKGSVALYCKDRVWHLLFVTDPCHDVSFIDGVHHTKPVSLGILESERSAKFTTGTEPSARGFEGAALGSFLNMHGDGLHELRPGQKARLGVHRNRKDGHGLLHMTVPFGVIMVTKETAKEYFTQQTTAPSRKPFGRKVASQFVISYNVTDPKGMTLTLDPAAAGSPLVYPIDLGRVVINIDNECNDVRKYNDFIHHYEWLRDSTLTPDGKLIRFIAGQEGAVDFPMPDEDYKATLGVLSPIFGDCDPVVIEPPPEPPV